MLKQNKFTIDEIEYASEDDYLTRKHGFKAVSKEEMQQNLDILDFEVA